ncbi:MAG: putative spermidine/putrescine transport system substrate-binding protein [Solirubrobacterales bacterium]|jgi:putative spermidine/putrescine transport system substrate-binding protein|nr:putative spermidine/putrescine transport system substrate-binding protein [Solirubrobacterales bacterium]
MRRRDGNPARTAWLVVAGLVVFMLALAGCGGGSDDTTGGSSSDELQKVGKGEGEVSLISWAGYVEPGWSKPFEQKTGCKVNNKEAGTSDEMVELMKTGQYDGVSASGNATARLVAAGLVAPVNVDLVPNYKTVFSDLKDQPYNTFEDVHYGIPHGRGANLLMWNGNDVSPAPDSWNVTLDPKVAAQYKGKISQYDDPMSIAEAAVYLKTHEPDLGIENPYELNEDQFNAAVDLLKEQHALVGEYWSEAAKQISAYAGGDVQVGTTWQYQYFALKEEGVPVKASPASQGFLPKEGATGWSDTWMLAKDAKHPNCMYEWMNWIIEPKVNAEVAEWFGEAPAQELACKETANKNFCAEYHAEEPQFWERVYYWETPLADCGNGEEDCMDYNDWVKAWTTIKG